MHFGGRNGVGFVWAWALVLLGVAGCQPNSGSLGSTYLSQTAFVTAVPSIEGMVQASVGGRQTLYVAFNGLGLQQLRDLQITGGLALPAGWNGPGTFSCSEIGRDRLCELPLTYTPTSSGSGTLALNFSYIDEAGSTHSGSLRIPYSSSSNNNIVATATPTGQINAVIGAGGQSVQVAFTTDDGNPATNFSLTSSLSSLPAGWSSPSGSFSCASVSTGNGCELSLSYAPTVMGSGVLTLNYGYTDNAGQSKSGALNIPYASDTNNSVIGTVAPSGQIAVSLGGSQSVTVTFDTNDGNGASNLSVTSDLSSLPTGWSSASGSFSCAAISTGNGCQLTLSYAPTAVASGSVTLQFSYTNDAGDEMSGLVIIPFVASSNDNVVGTPSPSGQINAVIAGAAQAVSVTFTTDDGNVASGLSITTDLASLPSGWSSGSSSFGCASVSTGNSCQLALSYAPSAIGSGTLNLSYSYTNNAGVSQSGTVSIRYLATTNDTVIGTAVPAGTFNVAVNASAPLTVTFTSSDGYLATGLSVTSNLASLPAGWSSGSGGSFGCASVSSGNGCQLSLTYAPSAAASGTLTLNYHYTNNAGSPESGSVSIPYTSNATIGGTVTGLNGSLSLQDNGADTLVLSSNGPFTFATALASGASYNVTVSAQPTGQTCTVANGSGTVSADVSSVAVSCSTNTYSIQGAVTGLSSSELVLTDNGGNALPVASGASSFAFSGPIAYGSAYAVAVSVQPSGQTCSVVNGSGTVTGAVTSVSVSCATNTYSIGGSVSGLSTTGLVLTDNGGNALPVASGSSAFTFSNKIAYGNAYAVALSVQPTGQTCSVVNGSGTVTGAVSSVSVSCATNTYGIGGSVSGLSQSGLMLTDNGGNALGVISGSSSFTFSNQLAYGASYAVAVSTQPTGQTCTVSSGSGTVAGTVSSVSVSCTTNTYTIGGTISGLSQNGLVLTDNGGNALPVSSGSSSFTFASQLSYDASYAVAIGTQPTGQTCTVGSGSGTVTAAVTSVTVSCTTNTYSIGGSVSGLSQSGLVLTDNGGNATVVISGATSFSFSNQIAYGSAYAVAVSAQPTGQTCTVSSGSGTVTGTVSSVSVSCTTNTYNIGGSISGLAQNGLVLTDNGGNFLSLSSGSTSFTFTIPLSYGASYAVAVGTQPTGQTCTVSSGSGTVTGVISSVSVSCTSNTYSIGGSISGLTASGLALTDNGGNALGVISGSSSFTFSNQLSYGASYAVAVSAQPTGQTCTVSSGSGTVNGTVSSVSVSCTTNTYTIGGSVSGLTANGLVLTDNGGNALSVSSGASSFTFSTPLSYNASYTVAVSTQPTGQLCTVASASGTVTATVTSVTVSCVASFTISGTISGLTVSSVVLANGTATVTVSAGASSWAFTGSFASGAAYAVTVQTQPTGETCQVTSAASGTLNANVSNVTVVCGYGQWTWQSGGNGDNESGVYGTLGTASASNVPRGEAYGMSWIDLSGNMWFFGGFGTSSSWYNNLWKYSPSSGEWTWENGSSSSGAHGVYGTKGVAAATNVPGARSSGVTWVDSSGNLWMFGGYGYDVNGNNSDLNDLWEYSPSSGEWTWVGGSNTVSASGVYGTKGTASASNIPGARAGPVTWKDASGNFWLFGGNNQSGDFNDLWTYNLSTGQWTWVSGSNGQNADGTYGTLGTASSSNVPPSEAYGTSWIDLSGNMWFFGGNNTSNDLNNLWKYNPSTGQWTWEGGTSGVNAHGVYGTLGVASSSNVPGARENPMSWTDSSGNFWLFGGLGYGSSGSSAGYLNDVWEFSTSSGQWTWVSGASSTNASGVYGTEGTASVGNVPGGRWGSFTWIDSSGNLWMLGGDGYDAAGGFGFLDDLWEFTPLQ